MATSVLALRLGETSWAKDMTAVQLTVTWLPSERVLSADYAVDNASDRPIVVFDRLFRQDITGRRTVARNLAFRRIEANGLLVAEKLIPALPQSIDVEFPVVPYGRLLAPGQRLTGRVEIEVPVTPFDPYDYRKPNLVPAQTTGALLRIGYCPVDDAFAAKPMAADGETLQIVRHAWAAPRQQVLQSPVTSLAVAALKPAP